MTDDGITLAQLRDELRHLVAMADTAERPKPDVINPRGHGMAGREWRVAQGFTRHLVFAFWGLADFTCLIITLRKAIICLSKHRAVVLKKE